nr:alpha/beta hydrolase [Planococcus beigongshangi]
MLAYRWFEGGVAVKPKNYGEIEAQVQIERDLSYGSAYKKGTLDIIAPKNFIGRLPVIFWVHGGAFLGGDKSDITEYAVQVASKGYIVVNMNYQLAPGAKYPTPLHQMNEAYRFIEKQAEVYSMDMDRLYFAGDSAGAQIVSQFVNVQVEKDYAQLVGIEGIVPPRQDSGRPFVLRSLRRIEIRGEQRQFPDQFPVRPGWLGVYRGAEMGKFRKSAAGFHDRSYFAGFPAVVHYRWQYWIV